jgi:hypothetical protein
VARGANFEREGAAFARIAAIEWGLTVCRQGHRAKQRDDRGCHNRYFHVIVPALEVAMPGSAGAPARGRFHK